MLFYCKKIGKNLRRVKFIRKSVPNRYARILRKLLYNFLSVASVFYSVKHSAEYTCRICNTFLFSYLRTRRVEVCHAHSEISCRHFKSASCTCARLFKNKSNIFALMNSVRYSRLFLCFQVSCQIYKIFYFLACKVEKFQKISSFELHIPSPFRIVSIF